MKLCTHTLTRTPAHWVGALVLCLGLGLACAKPEPPSTSPDSAEPSTELSEVERLCEHSYEVLIVPTGAGSPGVRADFNASCLTNSELRRTQLGELAWAERSTCVFAAQDPDALGLCDGRQPAPAKPTVAPDNLAQVEVVCDKIADDMQASFGAVIGKEQMDEFAKECRLDFTEQRRRDPAKFEAFSRCVLAAANFEIMVQCDSD